MARKLRFIPRGSPVEVSSRTMQGRFLLLPKKELVEIILGIIGRAQARYEMVIHAFVFLSDHFHMLLSPTSGRQLSDFMCYVKGNIAREAGRMHRWKDRFWGRRYESIVVSHEKAAQESRLKYILANGCKEGLVSTPREWPGVSVAQALLNGVRTLTGKWFDRTQEYRSRLNGEGKPCASEETVTLSPLPCWEGLTEEEMMQRVTELIGEIERETAEMHEEKGTTPLGVQAILEMHPHSVPKEMKHTAAPLFITATREAMQDLRERYRAFVSMYRRAAPRPFVDAAAPG